MSTKLLQVIPKSLQYTPDGGTAVTFTDFADPVSFTYETSYNDISSQSSDYVIGKLMTGRKASIKAVVNNADLSQIVSVTSGDSGEYTAATDTLSSHAGKFSVNSGQVVFTGYDTSSKKTVTITLTHSVAMVTGDMSFGKDQEVRVGVQFDAMKPADGASPAWTIVYSA